MKRFNKKTILNIVLIVGIILISSYLTVNFFAESSGEKTVHISLAAEKVLEIGGFPITNTLLMSWMAMVVLVVLSIIATRKVKAVPKGAQNFLETIMEFLLDLIDSITHNRKHSIKFFPLVATIFLFIVASNWMGLLPGIGTIGFHEESHGEEIFIPLLRSTNSDLNNTLALAIVSVVVIQVFGIIFIGFFKYAGKFFVSPLKKPYFVGTFVGILELTSEVSKMISFSFRLFGNIFAGEVLLVVVSLIVPYLVPLPFMFLELFVGFIQGLVFSMLTLVFLTTAVAEH